MDNTIVLQIEPTTENARNSEGAFITLKDGRILFAYSKYITDAHGDHAPSIIAARYSSDGGRTWSSQDRLLVERGNAINVMSVSFIRLQNGRILMGYLRKEEVGNGIVRCIPWVCFSDDEMETLSEPLPTTDSLGYHVVNNDRMIQLDNGRIIIPVAYHRLGMPSLQSPPNPHWDGMRREGLIFYLLSDDSGQVWNESGTSYYRGFAGDQGLQEPGVIELHNGNLWSWTRTGWINGGACGRQWQSFSADSGHTWTEPEPSQFVSPRSPLSMKRIPATGDLLAVWNDRSEFSTAKKALNRSACFTDRTPLVSIISNDEGKTWRHRLAIEDNPKQGFCYTAIHFHEDAVLLAYCSGDATTKTQLARLRIRRIALENLYQSDQEYVNPD